MTDETPIIKQKLETKPSFTPRTAALTLPLLNRLASGLVIEEDI